MAGINVKPAPDRHIRDPFSMEKLPAEGALVPKTQYWLNAIRRGDCIPADKVKSSGSEAPLETQTKTGGAQSPSKTDTKG